MRLSHIIIYAVIQGLAELLPVSSSAHVIAAAKLLKKDDPSSPEFTLMLVMLHTGTMFAVIVYFWKAWKRTFFNSLDGFARFATKIFIASAVTGAVGYGLVKVIEKAMDPGYTVLMSQGIRHTGSTPTTPTGRTLLIHLAAADRPESPLFHVGDSLALSGTRGGDPLQSEVFGVTPTSTLRELLKYFEHGFALDMTVKAHGNIPAPGARLIPDPADPSAVRIEITGNEGSDYKLKVPADGFVNQNKKTPIGIADANKAEVEQLFKHLDLMAAALAAAGILILVSGIASRNPKYTPRKGITTADSVVVGAVQGLCLPFRGFSRSGATISAGLLRGISRIRMEEFSFALAVAITPVAIYREVARLIEHQRQTSALPIGLHEFKPSLMGMGFSFLAGLVALKVLSKLLEKGQWWLFGIYCLAAASGIYWMHVNGYGS